MFNYYNNYNIADKGIDVLGNMYNSMELNRAYQLNNKSSKQLNTASLLNSLMRTGSSIFDSYWNNQERLQDQRDRYYDSFINNYSRGGQVKGTRNGQTKKSWRKGKKLAVWMDGKWHHFGDSKMQDYRTHKSNKRKKAYYNRHAKNLKGDSSRAKAFRAYSRKTWKDGGLVMTEMLPIYDNYQPTMNSNGSDFKSLFTGGGYSKQLGTKRKYRDDEVIYSTDHPKKTNSDIIHPGHTHMQRHVLEPVAYHEPKKTDSYMDFDTYRKQRGGYSYKVNYKTLKKWK